METLVDLSHWRGLIQGTGYTGRKKEPNGAPETTQSLAIAANCFSCWGSGAPGSSEPGVFGRTWDNCDDSWQQLGPLRQGLYRRNWSHGAAQLQQERSREAHAFFHCLSIFRSSTSDSLFKQPGSERQGSLGNVVPDYIPPEGEVCVCGGRGAEESHRQICNWSPCTLRRGDFFPHSKWSFIPIVFKSN